MVEVRKDWFCEAAWDGSFEEGGFDETDVVVGSGGRMRDGHLAFVSSGSTVDRIQSIAFDGGIWVSNSLACLLAASRDGIRLDDTAHLAFFASIISGLTLYRQELPLRRRTLRLTYFNNLHWTGLEAYQVPKPYPQRDFHTFEQYRRFLVTSLVALARNTSSADRALSYRLLGTISSGYDSPAVAVLAKNAGLEEALSFQSARGGASDDGSEIGRILGLRVLSIARDAWAGQSLPEVPFLAGNASGEDVPYCGARNVLERRLLLTGYHGDKMWDTHAPDLSEDIVRGDHSGLSLTEYRLWAGFLHCPVPFFAARQIRDINRLNNSPEVAAWHVKGGYSRPFCRRVVEEAGVPRQRFGVKKKAASVVFHTGHDHLSPHSMRDYWQWLRMRCPEWRARRASSRALGVALNRLGRACAAVSDSLEHLSRAAPGPPGALVGLTAKAFARIRDNVSVFRHLFRWAIEKATERYQVPGLPEVHSSMGGD